MEKMTISERLLPHVASAVQAFFRLPVSPSVRLVRGPGLGSGVRFRATWNSADGGSPCAESCYSMSDLLGHIAAGGSVKIDFNGAHHTIVLAGKGVLGSLTVAAARKQLESSL